ncbi:hypothetical protein [Nocardia sp. NPDC050406]|uniref:hypothetical protein n=1 Tax=Nocardia sp. NPDC050406 TaxID=3364318 RepID=UPI0037B123B8
MTLKDRLQEIPELDGAVYGTPHETKDGSIVITVTRPGGLFRTGPRPMGVFVIHEGKVTFEPVCDTTRLGLMGELIGLVAVAFVTGAILRRPPWPELSFHRTVDC